MSIHRFLYNTRSVLRRKSINGLLKSQSTKDQVIDAIVLWETHFGSHEGLVQNLADFARVLIASRPDVLMSETMLVNGLMQGLTRTALYENEYDYVAEASQRYDLHSKSKTALPSEQVVSISAKHEINHITESSNQTTNFGEQLNDQALFVAFVRLYLNSLATKHGMPTKTMCLDLIQNALQKIPKEFAPPWHTIITLTIPVQLTWTVLEMHNVFHIVYHCTVQTMGPVKTDALLKNVVNQSKQWSSQRSVEIFL